MLCATLFLAFASALALELPSKKKTNSASLNERVSRSGLVTEDIVTEIVPGVPVVPVVVSLAEARSNIIVSRIGNDATDTAIDTAAKAADTKKNVANSVIHGGGKLIPGETMANAFVTPNKQTDTNSVEGQTVVIAGPNQMFGESAVAKEEEFKDEDEPKRPWLLQILHDMLAPLHLPVIRGRALNAMQANSYMSGAGMGANATTGDKAHGHDNKRWHLLGGGGYDLSEYSHLPKAMAARLSVQDVAVLASVMLFYVCTILIALSLVYHTSTVSSGVKWFCEPEMLTTSSRTFDEFCQVFVRPPETRVRVVVTNRSATRKRLDVRLDVTSLVQDSDTADGGLDPSDTKTVMDFMRSGGTLSSLHIRKEVVWDGFETLEPKVAARVKELGFEGEVHVSLERSRDVVVRRNTQMFHFVHNQITSILVLMSIAGIFVFWPTVWLKKQNWYCKSGFKITQPADEYFPLLSEALPEALESAVESDGEIIPRGYD